MPDTKKLIGTRIKELRKQTGMTQEQLAEHVELDARHLSRLEVGRHYPSLASLERIAQVFNVPMVEFFQFPEEESVEALRNFLINFAQRASESQLRLAVKAVKLVVG